MLAVEDLVDEVVRDYGSAAYWETRYAKSTEAFDFYVPWAAVAPVVASCLPTTTTMEVLIPGIGTSEAGIALSEAGHNVVAMDSSPTVVAAQRRAHAGRPRLRYALGDYRKVDAKAGSFDVVVDKAVLDTVLCAPENLQAVADCVDEAYRVLGDRGVFVVVSHGKPETRLAYFRRHAWRVEVRRLPKPPLDGDEAGDYFVYVCQKQKKSTTT
mmetsp:Transcript_9636/g.24506  ORF Transcript_9636/g.24506 Transcript_9636/m.24506 type:complete len:212 (+) Transcript_9636:700-1335(+)